MYLPFFFYTQQASDLDPQTRWILEGVWNAILDSRSLSFEDLSNMKVGTFCGIMNNDVAILRDIAGLDFSLNASNGGVSGFVSHAFGFHGPSADLNTMCSSGLVCLNFAVDEIQKGACDVAVVAAANWIGGGQMFSKVGSVNALSHSGLQDCLGRNPDGYIRGEGMVVFLLQRLEDVKEGGTVRCVVEAIASTHHGQGGLSSSVVMPTNVAAPVPESYTNSYERCFELEPSLSKNDVVYVELHATATVRGDKAELDSIRNYYAKGREINKSGSITGSKTLWLGGNKSIFGHTEPVSGLLSITKLLLAFEKGIVPPTLFITDPNGDLNDISAQYDIEVAHAPLSMDFFRRGLFAVTASGMSGTTTHVIFRPPTPADLPKRLDPPLDHMDVAWPPMLTISTHSNPSCKAWRNDFSVALKGKPLMRDLSTPKNGMLYKSRDGSAVCSVAAFDEVSNISELLEEAPVIRNPPSVVDIGQTSADIILGFGGVGLVQYGVGNRLYKTWPSFREAVDQVDEMFRQSKICKLFQNQSLAELCGTIQKNPDHAAELPTKLMQPATFMVQYAQAAALTKDFNVCIAAVIGHSFGEIVAAVVSGCLTLKAGVTLTLIRTQACLDLEASMDEAMAMLLCTNLSYEAKSTAFDKQKKSDKIFVSGIMAENEFLFSGTRHELEKLESDVTSMGASTVWIESTVAFHSPFVAGVGRAVEEAFNELILEESSLDVTADLFMTSVGGKAEKSTLQSYEFWVNAVLKPINLKDAMRELEASYGPRTEPLFDMTPRGLYVNWFRRNADSKQQLPSRTSSAMTYSFDFVRVLQNYRKRFSKVDSRQNQVISLPAYPFRMQNCNPVPKDLLVHAKEISETKACSVYNRKTCLETVFENLDDVSSSLVSTSECIGIELASSGDAIWNALWGSTTSSNEKQQRVIKDIQTLDTQVYTLFQTDACKTTLIVVGPLKGAAKKNEFEDAFSMEAPYDFIEKFQEQVVKSDSSVRGILFVSGDASHAGFEFVSAFFASLRFKVRHLSFVSMLRLSERVGERISEVLDRDTFLKALNAAAGGESLLQLTDQGEVQGCRIVPMARPLSWKIDWVKADCLYVVTGALSAIATTFLPALAEIGVRHFLFLTHHREPSDLFVKKLRERGATFVLSERCNIAEVPSIRSAVHKGLMASGAIRVAGVFHLAGIADDASSIPVPTDQLKRVMNVKYEGQRALLQAVDLLDGDIFCVPGSISSVVGSPGVAYSASQNACRALQVHASRRLRAPFPILGISDASISNTILGDTVELQKRARRNGILTTASQVFNLAMMHPATAPTATKDVLLLRANAQILDEYMNAIAPNFLFRKLSQLEEDLR
jgi:acyl transferase domain-containing protein